MLGVQVSAMLDRHSAMQRPSGSVATCKQKDCNIKAQQVLSSRIALVKCILGVKDIANILAGSCVALLAEHQVT